MVIINEKESEHRFLEVKVNMQNKPCGKRRHTPAASALKKQSRIILVCRFLTFLNGTRNGNLYETKLLR